MRISNLANKRYFPYLLAAGLIFIIFAVTTAYYPYIYYADYWDHSPALKELSINLFTDKDPSLMAEAQSPRYNPYIFIWALFIKITGLSIFAALKIAGLLNLFLFLASFYLFAYEFSKDRSMPVYGLLMLLFFWGFGWNISSAYHFKVLMFVLPYPSFFSFSLTMLGLYLVLRYIREGKNFLYIPSFLIGYIILLTHLQTFTFFMLSALLMAFFENYSSLKSKLLSFVPFTGFFRRENLLILIMPIALFLLSFLWPYYNLYSLFIIVQGLAPWTAETKDILLKSGPLLLVGIPVWISYFRSRKLRFLWSGFVISSLAFLVFYFFKKPVQGERYFFYMAFYLQLLIAFKYKELGIFSKKKWLADIREFSKRGIGFLTGILKSKYYLIRYLLAGILLLCIIFQLLLVGIYCIKYYDGRIEERMEIKDYHFLQKIVGDYDVVIADPQISFVFPSFSGRAIGFYINHINPFVSDYDRRAMDIETFFSKNATKDQRQEIISRYNASYILVNFRNEDMESYKGMQEHGETVHYDKKFALIKIAR